MIRFNRPVKFRGRFAAYIWYLSKEKGQERDGGVNVFNRLMDAYLYSIIVGLKNNYAIESDETPVVMSDIFNNSSSEIIKSADINTETVEDSENLLNYIYRIVMLSEQERKLSDAEKITNAFKSENNQEKIEQNISLMNSYSRGGLEIMYERFQGLTDRNAIMKAQLELMEDISGISEEFLDEE